MRSEMEDVEKRCQVRSLFAGPDFLLALGEGRRKPTTST
jgi:hypothetical protein